MSAPVPQHVATAFAFARGLWPNAKAPSSEATLLTWSPSLSRFTGDELCEAFEEAAKESPTFPPLANFLTRLHQRRAAEEAAKEPRLSAPSGLTGIAAMKAGFGLYRQERHDAIREQGRREAWSLNEIDEAIAAEDRRLRGLFGATSAAVSSWTAEAAS